MGPTLIGPASRAERMPRRRFGMLDAMILIAATAPALAALRGEDWIVLDSPNRPTVSNILFQTRHVFYLTSHLFAAWSFALIILRLRKPRPSLRRLMRQPGMVACTAAAIIAALTLMNATLVALVLTIDSRGRFFSEWWLDTLQVDALPATPSQIGQAIAAAWAIQALGGRWRPESSWIDRLGRAFAVYWIASVPSVCFSYLYEG